MRIVNPFLFALLGALGMAAPVKVLRAQSRPAARDTTMDEDEAHQTPPAFATGVSLGAMRFAGGRTENATSVILLYHPLPWLKLSTAPGYGRTSFGNVSRSGVTDIPFNAAAVRAFADAAWSPSLAGGLSATVASGDSSSALGSGRGSLEGNAALSLSPTDGFDLTAELSHPVLANSGNGSLGLESSVSLGRATASFGLSAEMGRPDSGAVLSRSLAAGVAWSLVGPLTLTVDGSHGISGSAPTWALSVGVGTAFAGISPLSPTSAIKRLGTTLGRKAAATSGYAKTNGSSTSCRRLGTC